MQVLRFGFNLVLTRLLLPEVFGLMALVDLFLLGLHMFSDVGLGLSIVTDLAALYGGSLTLGSAPIGGLRAELLLPGVL